MYRNYFGLTELPFSIAPDPRYLYMSEKHREGLAHLLFGLQSDCGFVLLTGEVGTGKTTVCRCLLEQIPKDTNIAFILNPKLTVEELLATICEEFKIGYSTGSGNKVLIDRINDYLLENHAKGRKAVLIIDEAQNLDTELLEQLRLLTNLETNERKLLQILLLGQPELRDKLAKPELRQLAQRITARYHLEPLNREEVRAYMAHRLEVAGGRGKLFPPACLKLIHRMTGGVPRLINILCDRALLGAYVEGKEKVDKKVLRQAAQEAFGGEKKMEGPHGGRRRLAVLAGGASLAVFAGLFLLWAVRPGLLPSGLLPNDLLPKGLLSAAPDAPSEDSSSTLPKKMADANVVPLQWPDTESSAVSRQTAFRNLFSEWGIAYDGGKDGDACEYAASQGLRCLEQKDGWQSLLHFNRPAVLKIEDGAGRQFFAALTGVDRETAVLETGAMIQRVRISDLGSFWQGEFTLLWRPPSVYRNGIQLGAREPLVTWLSNCLARIEGQAPPAGDDLFSEKMEKRIKAFQFSAGLVPDGIVGPRTLIHINTAAGADVPRLVLDGGKA
jgi:general secretion pathway protein A